MIEVLFLSNRLLPLIPAGLLVQQILPAADRLIVVAAPRARSAICPGCSVPAGRIHSRYDRTLGDLPWQGRPVSLRIRARRFRCANPACSRRTFAERLHGVAMTAARRTERLADLQRCLALALGGEAGARLAGRLAMATSPDTLLRLACGGGGSRASPRRAPRVLGVDDWAWRRGQRYGTALVDLERNRVVDLLRDRTAETLAAWLRDHPGAEVVARDRAGAYADGIRQGAPEAVQVADRWHLLRNLGGAVQALADRHTDAVRRAARHAAGVQTAAAATASAPAPPPKPRQARAAQLASQASRARRQACYEEAARLSAEGVPLRRIAIRLGVERVTVRGWLRLGHAPLWRKPKGVSVLDPHRAFLEGRWAEGCRNAAQLWRELAARGFRGRPSTVRAWATARREGPSSTSSPRAVGTKWQLPSRRGLARLLMAAPETLEEVERIFVAKLLEEAPNLAHALAAAKGLRAVLRREGKGDLDQALAAAEETARICQNSRQGAPGLVSWGSPG